MLGRDQGGGNCLALQGDPWASEVLQVCAALSVTGLAAPHVGEARFTGQVPGGPCARDPLWRLTLRSPVPMCIARQQAVLRCESPALTAVCEGVLIVSAACVDLPSSVLQAAGMALRKPGLVVEPARAFRLRGFRSDGKFSPERQAVF